MNLNANSQILISFLLIGLCAAGSAYSGFLIKDGFDRKIKPELSFVIFGHGNKMSIPKGIQEFTFEPEIINNGNGVAKFINLKVKFPKDITVIFNQATWFLYKEDIYNILEYRSGVNDVIFEQGEFNNRLGLGDIKILLNNNKSQEIIAPFFIQCERMGQKKGQLVFEIKGK